MTNADMAGKGADSQQTGASSSAGSPGADATQPPQTQAQALTPEQIQKLIEQAIHDDRMKAGRDAKALETKAADIAAREARITKAEQEHELTELETVKDKPDELSIVQRRQKLAADIRVHNAEVEKQKAEWASHEAEIADARKTRFEASLLSVAEKHGVSAEILADKASKLGITETPALEELAGVLPKKNTVPVPDSGKSTGGIIEGKTPRELISLGLKKK